MPESRKSPATLPTTSASNFEFNDLSASSVEPLTACNVEPAACNVDPSAGDVDLHSSNSSAIDLESVNPLTVDLESGEGINVNLEPGGECMFAKDRPTTLKFIMSDEKLRKGVLSRIVQLRSYFVNNPDYTLYNCWPLSEKEVVSYMHWAVISVVLPYAPER